MGAQIDLVISRTDHCINLCGMKFCSDEFILDKGYATSLVHKKSQFRKVTKTKKSLFTTLITTYGAKENAQYLSSVENQLSMDVLFF
ncbi:MAG: ATPase [Verrucomicrobia bacterium]|nr:ATPase [Verrucomicrobiota bacterium]